MSTTLAERIKLAKKEILSEDNGKQKGYFPDDAEASQQLTKNIGQDMQALVEELDAVRAGATGRTNRRPADISFSDVMAERYGFARNEDGMVDSFLRGIGMRPAEDTLQYLLSAPDIDNGYRWIIPEIMREYIRLGLRRSPLYPNLIAAEENIAQPKVFMPYINMSDAKPTKIGEAETIPTGSLSFGQKDVKLQKVGMGLKLTDEVIKYSSLNLLAVFLSDMGVQIGQAQDVLMIDVLINGDGNSNGAPVIGVDDNSQGIQYKDILRAWIRMSLLGKLPQSMLSNENIALTTLTLPEFTNRQTYIPGQPGQPVINFRTPIPTTQLYDIHGAMPVDNQLMLIDRNSAVIKFNSAALRLENQRIVERQIEGAYASLTTGFANLFRDGRLIIDGSVDFGSQGFPTYMNPGAIQAAAGFRS